MEWPEEQVMAMPEVHGHGTCRHLTLEKWNMEMRSNRMNHAAGVQGSAPDVSPSFLHAAVVQVPAQHNEQGNYISARFANRSHQSIGDC